MIDIAKHTEISQIMQKKNANHASNPCIISCMTSIMTHDLPFPLKVFKSLLDISYLIMHVMMYIIQNTSCRCYLEDVPNLNIMSMIHKPSQICFLEIGIMGLIGYMKEDKVARF